MKAKATRTSPVARTRKTGAPSTPVAKPAVKPARPSSRQGGSTRPRRLLVPVDFSKASQAALKQAVALAGTFGGTVTLLHVVPPPAYPVDMGHIPIDLAALEQSSIEAAGRQLTAMAGKLDAAIRGEALVRPGMPGEVITVVARRQRMDWIVIATHGRKGLKRLLLGSTAEHVIRHASCPVLVVRQAASPSRR